MDYGFWMPIIILLIIIGGIYLGKRLKYLINFKNKYLKVLYWIILYVGLTLIVFLKNILSVFVLYALALYGIFDIVYIIVKKTKKEKLKKIMQKIYQNGLIVLIISAVALIYGIYNVNHPIIRNYDIKINKLKENSTIMMMSDLHLGTIQNKHVLEDIVEKVNNEDIDIFILDGDIFDENTTNEEKNEAYKKLSKIKTKYGIYYVEGNHDLLTKKVKENYEKVGIKVLDDKATLINNNYYLIGRCDYRRVKLNKGRKSLKKLYKDLNNKYPKIVLDHQPRTNEIKDIGADLQISGHTHGGQYFPGNFFLKQGYYKKKKYQMIVSSGYGVWSFSVRTASKSEMIKVRLYK